MLHRRQHRDHQRLQQRERCDPKGQHRERHLMMRPPAAHGHQGLLEAELGFRYESSRTEPESGFRSRQASRWTVRAHRQVAAGPARAGLDGGKMLLRIDMDNPGTVTTLAACAEAVTELSAQHPTAIIGPFMVKGGGHRAVNDLGTDSAT